MNYECNFCKVIKECAFRNNFSHAYLIETHDNDNLKEYINYMLNSLFISKENQNFFDGKFRENFIFLSIDEGMIKKEKIGYIQESYIKTTDLNKKIYLIEDASKFNLSSANALLKFLEEPPFGVYAILLTSNKNLVIPTILSRCVVLDLPVCNSIVENISLDALALIEMIEKNKLDSLIEYGAFLDFKKMSRDEFLIKMMKMKKIFEYVEENNFENIEGENLYFYLKNKGSIYLLKKISLLDNYVKKIDSNVNLNLLFDNFIIEYCEVK